MNVELTPNRKPDAEYAAELKERLKKPLDEVASIMTEAALARLLVSFNISMTPTGQGVVDRLDILKKL